MTTATANGSHNGTRSGAQTLALLAQQPNALILRALTDGPKQQNDLSREAGTPAQSTLRAQLRKLTELGAIAKHRRNRFPGVLEYELAPAGIELNLVAEVLEHWLGKCPDGPLVLGGTPAKTAIKALVDAWSTTMLRAMAVGPLSLIELDRIISSVSYPSLERRFRAMRLVGQIETRPSKGRGTPYAVTDWLRQGVAPLAAAGRWERRHQIEGAGKITLIDIETAFLLTVPLLALPPDLSGTCRMAVEISNGEPRRLASVVVSVKSGAIVSCITRYQGDTDAWAFGSPAAWFSAVIEGDRDVLELGGDGKLAHALVRELHQSLFKAPASPASS